MEQERQRLASTSCSTLQLLPTPAREQRSRGESVSNVRGQQGVGGQEALLSQLNNYILDLVTGFVSERNFSILHLVLCIRLPP